MLHSLLRQAGDITDYCNEVMGDPEELCSSGMPTYYSAIFVDGVIKSVVLLKDYDYLWEITSFASDTSDIDYGSCLFDSIKDYIRKIDNYCKELHVDVDFRYPDGAIESFETVSAFYRRNGFLFENEEYESADYSRDFWLYGKAKVKMVHVL